MSQERRCPQCGAELPANAPHGLCPACLLGQGMESRRPTEDSPSPSQGSPATGGFTPPLPADLAPHFPNLEILELLGQGGMGAVYKARQPGLDRLVALKVLPPGIGYDAAFAERFKREARSLARLNHPNIVTVYDFGEAAGLYYFIMEYVDGVNLRQMERAERPSPKQALCIVVQVCEALQFAHDEGIVHRDIKPENILLDKKGRVKIADFGLAKLLAKAPMDFTLTQPQQVMGTPAYMAPEQLEHPAEVDQRADIYSLGVVFYEMLTGELPLGRFAPPSQKFQLDVRLDEVVLKALEKEPARRYQHASEVRTDVQLISGGGGTSDRAAGAPEERRWDAWWFRRSGLTQRGIKTALILVTVAGMVGFLGYDQRLENPGEGPAHTVTRVGLWDPWYVSESTDGGGGRHEVNLYAGSCLFGLAAGLAACVGILILRGENRRQRAQQTLGRGDQHAGEVRTDVEEISRGPQAPATPAPAAAPAQVPVPVRPHLSRAAIFGAVLVPLAIALTGPLAAVFVVEEVDAPGGGMVKDSWGGIAMLAIVVLSVLGLMAPIATTILGIVAISQIRRSCGRLCGMGLALFDALVFPLIALDCLLVVACALAIENVWDSLALGIVLGILIAIAVDVVIVWLVNRAVRRPAPGGAAVTQAAASKEPPPAEPH